MVFAACLNLQTLPASRGLEILYAARFPSPKNGQMDTIVRLLPAMILATAFAAISGTAIAQPPWVEQAQRQHETEKRIREQIREQEKRQRAFHRETFKRQADVRRETQKQFEEMQREDANRSFENQREWQKHYAEQIRENAKFHAELGRGQCYSGQFAPQCGRNHGQPLPTPYYFPMPVQPWHNQSIQVSPPAQSVPLDFGT
jgi:hypothetical protein